MKYEVQYHWTASSPDTGTLLFYKSHVEQKQEWRRDVFCVTEYSLKVSRWLQFSLWHN